jgi:hypothetical protein
MNRLERLKQQHQDLDVSLIDIISFLDPTDSYKYLEFLIKNFKNENDYYSPNKEEFMGYMGVFLFGSGEIETLNEFERHSKANRIKNKDISSYNDFLELHEVVKKAEEIEKRKRIEKEIIKIHEDDIWLVLTPLSFESAKIYGSNTKWCVTQEKYWVDYLSTHRLIYLINKENGWKMAFSRNFRLNNGRRSFGNEVQAWDQQDKEQDPMSIENIPDEIFLKIKKELQIYKTTGELCGIKNETLLTTSDSFHGTIHHNSHITTTRSFGEIMGLYTPNSPIDGLTYNSPWSQSSDIIELDDLP